MMQAFIDMGTNTIKLQFASGEEDFSEGLAMSQIVRLGDGADENLHPDSMKRALDALETFDQEIKRRVASPVRLYATSATREAANGRAFLNEIEEKFGWSAQILSGKEEAELGFLGAGLGPYDAITLIDIGGGSTEISVGENVPEVSKSFPLGALKHTRSPRDLSEVFKELPERKGELLGIGGTLRILAAIRNDVKKYRRADLHGATLEREWLRELQQRVATMNIEEKRELCAFEPERADIIDAGLQILLYLMDRYQAQKLTYSDYGMIEGFALKTWGRA